MTLPAFHIPTPCSEDWDGMTPTACGRFCNVCQKEVIDLSVMDDATVAQTIAEKGNDLCARARKDQLAPPMTAVRSFSLAKLALFALALVSVFSGGLVTEVKAQVADSLIRMGEDTLTKGSEVTVKVLGEGNNPMENIKVHCMYFIDGAIGRVRIESVGFTDANGETVFRNISGQIVLFFVDSLLNKTEKSKGYIVSEGFKGDSLVFVEDKSKKHEVTIYLKKYTVEHLRKISACYVGRIRVRDIPSQELNNNYFDLQDLRRIPSR